VRTVRWSRVLVWLLAAVALAQAIGFGACPQDDAFISFRYAENLVRGEGLVYNPGERVEGFTNLAWTLLVAAAMWLGAEPVAFTLAAGLACLGGIVLLVPRLARDGLAAPARPSQALLGPPPVDPSDALLAGLVATALVATDPALILEAVQGLETAFYTLLGLGATLVALGERRDGRGHVGSSVLFALAACARPEGPVLWAGVHVGLAWDARVTAGRPGLRRQVGASLEGVWPLALVVAGLLAFRLIYYGEPVPNTFYAKAGGGLAAVGRGLRYLVAHAGTHPLLWILVAVRLVAPPLLGLPFSRAGRVGAATAGLYLACVALLGGDFKPTGRFVHPVTPCLALLAGEAMVALGRRVQGAGRWGLAAALLAVGLGGGITAAREAGVSARDRHANLEARRTLGEWIAAYFPPDAVLAIHSAGAVPYYAGLRTIDMWGLTDPHIARRPAAGTGMAGHEKTDAAYVFGRRPALYVPEDHAFVLRPWDLEPEPGFPPDFEERYRAVHIPVEGRWLNAWIRADLAPLAPRPPAPAEPAGQGSVPTW
jgi:arabinofuranosyltransferase